MRGLLVGHSLRVRFLSMSPSIHNCGYRPRCLAMLSSSMTGEDRQLGGRSERAIESLMNERAGRRLGGLFQHCTYSSSYLAGRLVV